jgi:hypothetical protein
MQEVVTSCLLISSYSIWSSSNELISPEKAPKVETSARSGLTMDSSVGQYERFFFSPSGEKLQDDLS